MIIARRTLHVISARARAEIGVRLYLPEERDGCWRCDYEIDWPERTRRFASAGHDSMQALSLALKMIGSEIVARAEYQAGDISIDGNYRGCGFRLRTTSATVCATTMRSSSDESGLSGQLHLIPTLVVR